MNKNIIKWGDYLNYFFNLIFTTFVFYTIVTHFYSFVFEYLLFQKWVPLSIRAIRPIFCLIALQFDVLNNLILYQFSLMTNYTLLSQFHGNKKLNWGFLALINRLMSMLINLFSLSIPEFLLTASLFAVSYPLFTFNFILSLAGVSITEWIYSYAIFEITALSLILTSLLFPDLFNAKSPNIRFRSAVIFIILLKLYSQPLLHLPLIKVLYDTSHLLSDSLLLAMTLTFCIESEKHWQTVSFSDHTLNLENSLKTAPESSMSSSTPSSNFSSINQTPISTQGNNISDELSKPLITPQQHYSLTKKSPQPPSLNKLSIGKSK